MTKKLLTKTSAVYLIYSLMILLISAPLFYYIEQSLYMEETDETLVLHKNEFLKSQLPHLHISDIDSWNRFNRDIKIKPTSQISSDTVFSVFYYDELDAENEPYRELNSIVQIDGKPFVYSARVNMIEKEDLIESIAMLFFAIIAILLSGILIITKLLSANIWKPFYRTLTQIESFEIDKNTIPEFVTTNIEEFTRLNKSIGELIRNNVGIYKSQKEFIENAAHELQTPLAVFQAKIDTLIQDPEITVKQSEILVSLNESAFRLNRLNKNLLLLSKIENENYGQKESLNLNEYLTKNLDFFNEQALGKNLTININLPDTIELRSNPFLLEILISNLFLNAIRHNIPNGWITVTLDKKKLCFSNTGSEKILNPDTLFNRFSKSDPSSQGNGLGLAIIKKIADVNGWTLSYDKEKNIHYFSVNF